MQSVDDLIRNYKPRSRRRLAGPSHQTASRQLVDHQVPSHFENTIDQFPSTLETDPLPTRDQNPFSVMGNPGQAFPLDDRWAPQAFSATNVTSRIALLESANEELRRQISVYEDKIQTLERYLDVFFCKLERLEGH